MASNFKDIIACIESEGYRVTSYRPDTRRIYSINKPIGDFGALLTVMPHLYANELRVWFKGYLEGLKIES